MAKKKTRSRNRKTIGSFHLYMGMGNLINKHFEKHVKGLTNEAFFNTLSFRLARHFHEEGYDLEGLLLDSTVTDILSDAPLIKNNVPIIFPESESLINVLNESKFSFKKAVNVKFPFDCFTIAMPKNKLYGDIEGKGMFVKKGSFNQLYLENKFEFAKGVYTLSHANSYPMYTCSDSQRYFELLEAAIQGKEMSEQDYYCIKREYKINGELMKEDFIIAKDCLSLSLKAGNAEELAKLIQQHSEDRKYHDQLLKSLKDDEISQFVYETVRTVASLGVYYSLDNNKLKPGLPGEYARTIKPIKYGNEYPDRYFLESTEAIRNNALNSQGRKEKHYRRFHFRNLHHKKYYQNEHIDKTPGSRWVFVNDSLINTNDDPYTATKCAA